MQQFLSRRLVIFLMSVGACISATGCFSCTTVRQPAPQVNVQPAPVIVQPGTTVVQPPPQ